jgi:NAD-dependent aldehyde dehydrogenases
MQYMPKSYIQGDWVDARDLKTFDVINPATQTVVASVADLSADDAMAALDAAENAFSEWSKYTAKARSDILMCWYHLIRDHADALADLITQEMGKPRAEALAEVNYGASFVDWFAAEARRTYGQIIPAHMPDKRIMAIQQPVGVVLAITPWNFPLAMITRKVSPALAAGCTVVVKPSEDTP